MSHRTHPYRQIITQPREWIARWVQVKQNLEDPWTHGYTTLGYFDYKKQGLIAAVVFDRFTKREDDCFQDCCLHVAGEGMWATKEFLFAVFDYVFNQLNCVRVTGLVAASNESARRFDEHLGFTNEATISKELPCSDLIVYRMFKQDCRWIKPEVKHGRRQKLPRRA